MFSPTPVPDRGDPVPATSDNTVYTSCYYGNSNFQVRDDVLATSVVLIAVHVALWYCAMGQILYMHIPCQILVALYVKDCYAILSVV